jgi:hypothetical protein
VFSELARGGYANRALLGAHLETLRSEIALPELESPHFTVFVAADATADAEGFAELLVKLANLGASWITCWGPGADRAPDIVYGEAFPTGWHVTTTWHALDQLDEALETFLWASAPDESTDGECHAGLVLSVGTVLEPEELKRALLAELAA